MIKNSVAYFESEKDVNNRENEYYLLKHVYDFKKYLGISFSET